MLRLQLVHVGELLLLLLGVALLLLLQQHTAVVTSGLLALRLKRVLQLNLAVLLGDYCLHVEELNPSSDINAINTGGCNYSMKLIVEMHFSMNLLYRRRSSAYQFTASRISTVHVMHSSLERVWISYISGVLVILPAEQPAVLQPALRFGLQAKGDLSLTSGFLVFPDLIVHLRDGVFDQRQALHQRLVLVCVRWKELKEVLVEREHVFHPREEPLKPGLLYQRRLLQLTLLLEFTIDDFLSLNILFGQGPQVVLVHSHAPRLRLQVLVVGLQLSSQQSIVDGLSQRGSQRHRVLSDELHPEAFDLIHLHGTGSS
ncbi:hypothetical protein EYF80_031727 [Liparis tanakae]|uniref:Uncharacterized protein n=1 Tax=Liparis tanakae TaxID=230148 RepID=A0A4Z2GY68_9TELE|nr:hypothetical protein EYF80_031727 [Liparis tanakae]